MQALREGEDRELSAALARLLRRETMPPTVDVWVRRELIRVMGWALCDDDGGTHCTCDETEPARPLTDGDVCTGVWTECDGCEAQLGYLLDTGEAMYCRACHQEWRCQREEGACGDGDGCELFPFDWDRELGKMSVASGVPVRELDARVRLCPYCLQPDAHDPSEGEVCPERW